MKATPEDWDQWFIATGDEESLKTWLVARQVHTDPDMLNMWGTIIELNRLDRIIEEKTPHSVAL